VKLLIPVMALTGAIAMLAVDLSARALAYL
jgi:ABC-type Fe3+-siderophore transport system permease subunit